MLGNIFQNILVSVFFIVLAREYNQTELGHYIVANTMYSMILGFSTLGLGNWFIRSLLNQKDDAVIIETFFKLQWIIGIVFYGINMIVTCVLYDNQAIRILSLVIGTNIILDNLIYVVKYVNIARQQQKRSFLITLIESSLKCLLAILVMYFHLSILILAIVLVIFRLFSLNTFIQYGSLSGISMLKILQSKIKKNEILGIVGKNWPFVVIGSISVLYWSIGNIIISKNLTWIDVAHYEISYKLLAISYMLPIVAASSIYPMLIKTYQQGKFELRKLYENAILPFMIYGLLTFTFVASYSSTLIPWIFGSKYSQTSQYCTEMFWVMLIFPVTYFQANVLITLHMEKIDMICNAASLLAHILICIIGISYYPTLSIVNYSIAASFLLFRVIQDWILVKNNVSTRKKTLSHYLAIIICLTGYYTLSYTLSKELAFGVWWGIIGFIAAILYIFKVKPFNHEKIAVQS
jgi:O-antigen/teichoic acid export membrane protein